MVKVFLINNCYPIHSTGKIVRSIQKGLKEAGYQVVIAFAWDNKRAENIKEHIYQYGFLWEKYLSALFTRIYGNQYGYAWISTLYLLSLIEREHPDVVNIHCANCYSTNHYMLLNWLRKKKYKVVITEHAEYYHTGNCSHAFDCNKWRYGCGRCPRKYSAMHSKFIDASMYHWKRMKKLMDKFNEDLVVTCVSPWLYDRSLMSPIVNKHKHFCIYNSVNSSIFFRRSDSECMREIGNIKNYILFVTPDNIQKVGDRKGGGYILELACKLNNIHFVIVGSEMISGSPDNITFIGHTNNARILSCYYSQAAVTILASKGETFSLVTAESLCCGTPVVGFRCGGAESIALEDYSEFVNYGKIEELHKILKKWLSIEIDRKKLSELAISRYSEEKMQKEYINVYNHIYKV